MFTFEWGIFPVIAEWGTDSNRLRILIFRKKKGRKEPLFLAYLQNKQQSVEKHPKFPHCISHTLDLSYFLNQYMTTSGISGSLWTDFNMQEN